MTAHRRLRGHLVSLYLQLPQVSRMFGPESSWQAVFCSLTQVGRDLHLARSSRGNLPRGDR